MLSTVTCCWHFICLPCSAWLMVQLMAGTIGNRGGQQDSLLAVHLNLSNAGWQSGPRGMCSNGSQSLPTMQVQSTSYMKSEENICKVLGDDHNRCCMLCKLYQKILSTTANLFDENCSFKHAMACINSIQSVAVKASSMLGLCSMPTLERKEICGSGATRIHDHPHKPV